MKRKSTVGVALLMCMAMTFGYWLGYENGSTPTVPRLNGVSSLKKIGLSFRGGRNDLVRFTATSPVLTEKIETLDWQD